MDVDKKDNPQALGSHKDMGSPSSRRWLPGATAGVEARRWFRKSYMEALRNPVPLGSGSKESVLVEACVQHKEPGAANGLTQTEPASRQEDPQETRSQKSCPEAPGKTLPRRSRSWDTSPRSSRDDVQRASRHSACAGPGGLLGGQAVETRNSEEGKCPLSSPCTAPSLLLLSPRSCSVSFGLLPPCSRSLSP